MSSTCWEECGAATADDPDADEQDPSWSPSADQIAYKSIAEAKEWPETLDRVWVMDSNGDNRRAVDQRWTSLAPRRRRAGAGVDVVAADESRRRRVG